MTSSRFDGRRFHNPGRSASRGIGEVLRWQMTADRRPWPARIALAREGVLPSGLPDAHAAATFVNHATFVLQLGGLTLVTDPVWSERASPVRFAGPRRVHPPGIRLEAIPRVDLVLLSHNHYDHFDRPTLERIEAEHEAPIVTLRGNEAYLRRHDARRVRAIDWWQSVDVAGLRVTATPAQHFSGRGLFDRDRALWGGLVVEWDGPTVFFAADTGYWSHFREVRDRFGTVGLALLPIGAYEPRWFMGPAHMNPADAVRAHLDLGGPPSVGMHFGTFRLTDEGWDDPPRALAAALDQSRVDPARFRVPTPGETFVVGPEGFTGQR
jgi:L-ascorbate metabolism protein UlaG (beta-lactamase superfamily)